MGFYSGQPFTQNEKFRIPFISSSWLSHKWNLFAFLSGREGWTVWWDWVKVLTSRITYFKLNPENEVWKNWDPIIPPAHNLCSHPKLIMPFMSKFIKSFTSLALHLDLSRNCTACIALHTIYLFDFHYFYECDLKGVSEISQMTEWKYCKNNLILIYVWTLFIKSNKSRL